MFRRMFDDILLFKNDHYFLNVMKKTKNSPNSNSKIKAKDIDEKQGRQGV